ncbi:MAG: Ig-like domain-containing protein [Flavisolibacter sp.]|nr:Ig-like domain-containing protein [Flavisolibacter sp.]
MQQLGSKAATVIALLAVVFSFGSCDKENGGDTPPVNETFNFVAARLDNRSPGIQYNNVGTSPVIRLSFTAPVNKSSVVANILLKENNSTNVPVNISYENSDSIVVLTPQNPLKYLSRFSVNVSDQLLSSGGGKLNSNIDVILITAIDPADKFPRISDEALLDLVQRQTFKYFWDFGHPVSGMARERNTSGDLVTTGGTGFGVMAIIVGIERNFISRAEGLNRIRTIADFLNDKAQKYHGAFAHWLHGSAGTTIPFSANDNGGDLVETSFLMQGLLTARQYFSNTNAEETELRNKINALWNGVEWNWYRRNNENVLYWHWSPDKQWVMNHQIRGWNEALITYVLAASSNTHAIDAVVYNEGWARNGAIRNGNTYHGIKLPLGPPLGGPLFFAHYSFLGIDPNNLSDQYANYWEQNTAHSLIHYNYSIANPRNFAGYSDSVWGLTASDDPNGYKAHEPNNDNGTISPTAALSSFPYTPTESMKALNFFYYKLGDRIWKEYGFTDAFNLSIPWFANSFLAIDQGPIIIMIENHRSGLLWKLFTSAPEVKTGLKKLGFQAPYL